MECVVCRMIFNESVGQCPKCDTDIKEMFMNAILEVDVAHQNETWYEAEEKILNAFDRALLLNYRALKVIHGGGERDGHTNRIKTRAIPFMRALASRYDCRYVRDNYSEGASLIFLKNYRGA